MSDKEVAPEWVGGSYTGDLNPRILQVLKIPGRQRLVLQPSSWMFLPASMLLFSGNQNPRISGDLNPWFLQEFEMLDYLELVLLSSIIHRKHLTSFDAFVFRKLKSPNIWGFKPRFCRNWKCSIILNCSYCRQLFIVNVQPALLLSFSRN